MGRRIFFMVWSLVGLVGEVREGGGVVEGRLGSLENGNESVYAARRRKNRWKSDGLTDGRTDGWWWRMGDERYRFGKVSFCVDGYPKEVPKDFHGWLACTRCPYTRTQTHTRPNRKKGLTVVWGGEGEGVRRVKA